MPRKRQKEPPAKISSIYRKISRTKKFDSLCNSRRNQVKTVIYWQWYSRHGWPQWSYWSDSDRDNNTRCRSSQSVLCVVYTYIADTLCTREHYVVGEDVKVRQLMFDIEATKACPPTPRYCLLLPL